MLLSIALILTLGLLFGWICGRLRLPGLTGMILTGIILGPYALNILDSSILDISAQLRKIALIIILMRAGLSLNMGDLKKVGRPAVLMCFLPACFEILGMLILAPRLLNISLIEAGIMGAVVGAVSPAVIVPRMIRLNEEKYGTDKSIPQLILAGASVDDVFVIVMFTAFTALAQGDSVSVINFINIPVSVAAGLAAGLAAGIALAVFFRRTHIHDTVKLIIILCAAFFMTAIEDGFPAVPFASLIGVMGAGIGLKFKQPKTARQLSSILNKLWIGAEVFLFVLVGATVNISYAASAGLTGAILILCVLLFRMAGVFCCLIHTRLNKKERLFCMMAYIPKATVQAAIGGVPLAMGLACGDIVLTVAVLAILITAPLGAFLIDFSYKRLLNS